MLAVVNIIGAGNLGKTLSHLFVKLGLVKMGGVCNRTRESSLEAIKFIGDGDCYSEINKLPSADITLLTTPDDLITEVCQELSKNESLRKGSIIIHCSGSLTSDALLSIKKRGCYIASVHPMASFAKPELSILRYQGTYCAVEGDEEVLPYIRELFNSIGSVTYEIDKSKKSFYHIAGVYASNYLVTLAQKSLVYMKESGVEEQMAMQIITNIMRGVVSNLDKTLSPKASLTGPIQRGDIATIIKHIESLNEQERKLYALLGEEALELTSHDQTKIEGIKSILREKKW